MDIWVEKSAENYNRLTSTFATFGMPVFDMTVYNFLNNQAPDIFTFGRPPVAIDIITNLKGLEFTEAYAAAADKDVDGVSVRFIQYQRLRQAKKAAGLPRDQNDLDNLSEGKQV